MKRYIGWGLHAKSCTKIVIVWPPLIVLVLKIFQKKLTDLLKIKMSKQVDRLATHDISEDN